MTGPPCSVSGVTCLLFNNGLRHALRVLGPILNESSSNFAYIKSCLRGAGVVVTMATHVVQWYSVLQLCAAVLNDLPHIPDW